MKVTSALLCLSASTVYAIPSLVARGQGDPCGFKFSIHKFPKENFENKNVQDPGFKYYANAAPLIAKFSEGCLVSKKPWTKDNQPRGGVCHALGYKWDEPNEKTPAKVHGKVLNDGNTDILVNQQFMLKVPETGDYTFTMLGPQDDITLLWLGDKALQGYTYENPDLKSEWFSQEENKTPDGKKDKSVVRTFNKDDVIPCRVVSINGQGTGSILAMHITGPDGKCMLGPKTGKSGANKTKGIYQSVGDNKFPDFPYCIKPVPGIRYTVHRFDKLDNDPKDKYFSTVKPVIEKISQDTKFECGDTYKLGYDYKQAPVTIYQTKLKDAGTYVCVSHKFFFLVPQDGDYTYTTLGPQDDISLLYLGDKALNGYSYDNPNLSSEWFSKDENTDEGNNKSVKKTYNKGEVIPIRILAINAQDAAKFAFQITGPEGVGPVLGPTTDKSTCKHIWATDPTDRTKPTVKPFTAPTNPAPIAVPVGPQGEKKFPANPYTVKAYTPDDDAGGY